MDDVHLFNALYTAISSIVGGVIAILTFTWRKSKKDSIREQHINEKLRNLDRRDMEVERLIHEHKLEDVQIHQDMLNKVEANKTSLTSINQAIVRFDTVLEFLSENVKEMKETVGKMDDKFVEGFRNLEKRLDRLNTNK